MKPRILLLLFLGILSLASCKRAAEEETKLVSLLRLHGSNTIGSKLAPELAEAFLREQGAKDIRRVQRAEEVEMVVEGRLPGEDIVSVIEIEAHGSSTSFTALKENRADIGMSSRPIKKEEASSLESLGNMRSLASEHVLALDGLAIIVHKANPVTTLDVDVIRRIFTGRITNWSRAGGDDLPIHVYARDEKSGTFETLKNLVLHGEEILPLSEDDRFEDSEKLSEAVAGDVSGIGFIAMPFIGEAKALKVFEDESLPMLPTRLTVKTEDYLLSRRLYLYTATNPEKPWIRKLIEFALSDEGQKVVDSAGFLGQALTGEEEEGEDREGEETAPPPSDFSRRYEELTRDAERQPFNIRFATGKSGLDNKAHRDIGRLLQFVEDVRDERLQVILLGFTDDAGDERKNYELSVQRAETVKRELISEGIVQTGPEAERTVVVEGFGEEKPVASNDTPDGRSKNRRVEVWLRRR